MLTFWFVDAICQFTSDSVRNNYKSKISISNDGQYLFSGSPNSAGIIWNTDLPNTGEPLLNLMLNIPTKSTEMTVSDWCADKWCMKVSFILLISTK